MVEKQMLDLLLASEDPVDFPDKTHAWDEFTHPGPGPWYPPGHPLHAAGATPHPTTEQEMF